MTEKSAQDKTNSFTQYRVTISPGRAPVRVSITLDGGGPTPEYVAGYLDFLDGDKDGLPDDEVSPVTGYILKHLPVDLLGPVIDLLHRQLQVLKKPMNIAAFTDDSGTLTTWLNTDGLSAKEIKALQSLEVRSHSTRIGRR
jgi:hypothetical protein